MKLFITVCTTANQWTPSLFQMNQVHIYISHYFKINFNIILPSISISLKKKSLLASNFLTKILYCICRYISIN